MNNGSRRPVRDRFLEKFDVDEKTGCWIWNACLNEHGYGLINTLRFGRPTSTLAHRLSWEIHRGGIPKGVGVLHNCPGGDNPRCVNPSHLWLGDQRANNRDMCRKGKHGLTLHPESRPRGERHGMSKLSAGVVRELRAAHRAGATFRGMARETGLSSTAISCAVKGRTWGHVK